MPKLFKKIAELHQKRVSGEKAVDSVDFGLSDKYYVDENSKVSNSTTVVAKKGWTSVKFSRDGDALYKGSQMMLDLDLSAMENTEGEKICVMRCKWMTLIKERSMLYVRHPVFDDQEPDSKASESGMYAAYEIVTEPVWLGDKQATLWAVTGYKDGDKSAYESKRIARAFTVTSGVVLASVEDNEKNTICSVRMTKGISGALGTSVNYELASGCDIVVIVALVSACTQDGKGNFGRFEGSGFS